MIVTFYGRCLDCDDEWSESDEIVICPECHSLNVRYVASRTVHEKPDVEEID